MTTFDDRTQAYERKFVLDGETAFKVNARKCKLVGLWAAAKLGKSGAEAEAYAKDVVMADFERSGEEDVIEHLLASFSAAGVNISVKDIHDELRVAENQAREEIVGKKG